MSIIQVFSYIKRRNAQYRKNGGVNGSIFTWGYLFVVMACVASMAMAYLGY